MPRGVIGNTAVFGAVILSSSLGGAAEEQMSYKEDIPRLRAEGKTYNEIIAITGAAKSTVSYYCGDSQPDKTAARSRGYRKQINNYKNRVKETTPCADCGQKYPYYVMHFDHLPGFPKLFNLSRFHDYTHDIEVVKREMNKCDIVCANCHSIRTHQRTKAKSSYDDDEMLLDELD